MTIVTKLGMWVLPYAKIRQLFFSLRIKFLRFKIDRILLNTPVFKLLNCLLNNGHSWLPVKIAIKEKQQLNNIKA